MDGLGTFSYAILFDLLVVVAELEAQRLHIAVIHAERMMQDVIEIPCVIAAAEKIHELRNPKWRCGPVERPVLPERAMMSPACTVCPTLARS